MKKEEGSKDKRAHAEGWYPPKKMKKEEGSKDKRAHAEGWYAKKKKKKRGRRNGEGKIKSKCHLAVLAWSFPGNQRINVCCRASHEKNE